MNERTTRKEVDLLAKVEDALNGTGFITQDNSTYLLLDSGTRLVARFRKTLTKHGWYLYKLAVSRNEDQEPVFELNAANPTFEKRLAAQIKRFAARERRQTLKRKKERHEALVQKPLRTNPPEESVLQIIANSKHFHLFCETCKTAKPQNEMKTQDLCETCSYNKELGIVN